MLVDLARANYERDVDAPNKIYTNLVCFITFFYCDDMFEGFVNTFGVMQHYREEGESQVKKGGTGIIKDCGLVCAVAGIGYDPDRLEFRKHYTSRLGRVSMISDNPPALYELQRIDINKNTEERIRREISDFLFLPFKTKKIDVDGELRAYNGTWRFPKLPFGEHYKNIITSGRVSSAVTIESTKFREDCLMDWLGYSMLAKKLDEILNPEEC